MGGGAEAGAGYVMIGIAAMTGAGFSAATYYLAAYYFMNLGAFGFLLYFEGILGSDKIEDLKGLGWSHPVVAIAMVVDLVSRLIFRSPLSGMIELQTFMLVFMAFFSVAYTMLKNQHVAVDRITSTLFCRVFSPFGGHSCLGR